MFGRKGYFYLISYENKYQACFNGVAISTKFIGYHDYLLQEFYFFPFFSNWHVFYGINNFVIIFDNTKKKIIHNNISTFTVIN